MLQALAYAHDANDAVTISDEDRRSGLYVLGRSGTGKTELLKRLILQDIENGHGVFFIDTHDDAIEDLVQRIPAHRLSDVVCLSADHETHSFAINLLACANIHSWTEREQAYTRAKGVFDKLWANMVVDLPWLQLIIEYTLPVFIQNPQYTLSEVPIFLTDPEFREHVLGSVRYNLDLLRFWRREFHQKQADAAITRVRILLGRPPVKHIVSQRDTTIDFASIIKERRILLFKLPAALAVDTKTFIGLILISELVNAVRQRPQRNRQQFCVFVDEFQHFASADDFAILINEGRKFGVATTVAHQERYGQLPEDRKLLGATDASGNKVFFQLSVADAQEQALEFAKPPPTEIRREQELAISQTPVADLLYRGHTDPIIRTFVRERLRPLSEQLQDSRDDMEAERLIRTDMLDESGLARIDERVDWLTSRGRGSNRILQRAGWAVERAREQTAKMRGILEASQDARQSIREINQFLTAVMEGKVAPGTEEFGDFLIARVAASPQVPDSHMVLLKLYISLTYGDAARWRAIPYDFAERTGLFSEECRFAKALIDLLTFEKQKEIAEEGRLKLAALIKDQQSEKKMLPGRGTYWQAVACDIVARLISPRGLIERLTPWGGYAIYAAFARFSCYSAIRALLKPLLNATFTPAWRPLIGGDFEGKLDIAGAIDAVSQSLVQGIYGGRVCYLRFMQRGVVKDLIRFLKRYKEGGFVTLAMLERGRMSIARITASPAGTLMSRNIWMTLSRGGSQFSAVDWGAEIAART